MKNNQFDFEKLEVYSKAMNFANEVFKLTKDYDKSIQYSLGDQFRRAALSICNNIAEGSGKQSGNAKRQFYGYAMDSARECIPMISLSLLQKHINKDESHVLREQCTDICNMLGGLISSTYTHTHKRAT